MDPAGTLPLALANYVLIERPLHLYGRKAAAAVTAAIGGCCGEADNKAAAAPALV